MHHDDAGDRVKKVVTIHPEEEYKCLDHISYSSKTHVNLVVALVEKSGDVQCQQETGNPECQYQILCKSIKMLVGWYCFEQSMGCGAGI